MKISLVQVVRLLVAIGLVVKTSSFQSTASISRWHGATHLDAAASNVETEKQQVDVVLFGVGDLRTDDHGGLLAASQQTGNKILPLVVLDDDTLSCLPGSVAHTADTAAMLSFALQSLEARLGELDLQLHVVSSETLAEGLGTILEQFPRDTTNVRLHACDLGSADNQIGYGPFSKLDVETNAVHGLELVPWQCRLREEPWSKTNKLPTKYPEYELQWLSSVPSRPSDRPLPLKDDRGMLLHGTKINAGSPDPIGLTERMMRLSKVSIDRCDAEKNTGLFGTHWGGLNAETIGEEGALDRLRLFVDECAEDDEIHAKVWPEISRNPSSLEHSTMLWNVRSPNGSDKPPMTQNLIAGECLTRFLAAPLFFGTVSPRRVWHMAQKVPLLFQNPLKSLVESSEWHKLLAARNIEVDPAYQYNETSSAASLVYKYYRWQGFLTRYAERSLSKGSKESSKKTGVLLVHGFGASATQWEKKIDSFAQELDGESDALDALAPDLIGFGQSEKPGITYSGYTWEAQVNDFVKEVAVGMNNWDDFVVGGNSIGGFTAMCVGANDATASTGALSANGAPGTARCNGVILMNPAGVIQTRDEVEKIVAAAQKTGSPLLSTASVTSQDLLPPKSPIARPIARAFGNGLLSYLRPRIRSICVNLYPTNPNAVDDTLCENILRDSLDPGAVNVMISGSKLPPPRTYNELIEADFGGTSTKGAASPVVESTFTGPILMPQGILDPLNDAKGRCENFGKLRPGIKVDQLQAGHCPHDEVPQEVAQSVIRWMRETKGEREAFSIRQQSMAFSDKTILQAS